MNTATLSHKSTRSTARDPHTVQLSWLSPTSRGALSSDGVTIYYLQQLAVGWSCNCRGYAARQTCCHSLAASLPRCYWCDSADAVTTYVNRNDNNSELTLCARCFSPKQEVK